MKTNNEMSPLRRRTLACALTFGLVVFGADFAPGQMPTPERPRNFGALGVDVRDLTVKLRTDNGIPTDVPGVLVADLSPTSALADREVRPGDVIVEVNGEAVETLAQFKEILAEVKAGQFLRVYLRRFNPYKPQTQGFSFFAVVRAP